MKDYFASAAKRIIPFVFLVISPLAARADSSGLRLLMFEEPGCIWCARWHEEIGPIYPKTAQAEAAPLTRLKLSDPLPDDVHLARPARFTPTFVLVAGVDEVGRIEGYPGDNFFWPLLDELLDQAARITAD